jgi:ferric-dicitrate binding protein FerR (iron transport regulator)
MPESEKRQAAIAGFCRGLAPVDPPAAAEWALSLRNEPTRTNVLQDALGAWRQTDPRAATAWALEKGVKTNPP